MNCLDFDLVDDFPQIAEVPLITSEWDIYGGEMGARTNYYNYYYSYGREWQPNFILEIGVRFGFSALAMCLGAGRHLVQYHGVDFEWWEDSNKIAHDLLRKWLPSGTIITLERCNTLDVDSLWLGSYDFDLIHVNANHDPVNTIHDMDLACEYAAFESRMIVDDCRDPVIREAVISWADKNHFPSRYVENLTGQVLIYVE